MRNAFPALAGRTFVPLAALVFLLAAAGPALAQGELARAERQAEMLIAQGLEEERARLAPEAPRLMSDPALDDIADARSEDMAEGAPFSHNDAQGNFIAEKMMRQRFGPYGTWGENILEEDGSPGPRGARPEDWDGDFDAQDFARRAVEGWMNSPGHRRNILDGDYQRCGIGVAVVGDRVYATEVFLGPPPRARRARRPL